MSNEIRELIDSIAGYRVLFVGDRIIDEYHYVDALNKSPKEHLIPVRYHDHEVFRGGVEAAASHLLTFCSQVDVTGCGPVTRKVRYVQRDYMRKLFEVHYVEESQGEPIPADGYDVIVVTDFGHGSVDSKDIETLLEVDAHLCVNAQTNSANFGYNLITKYERADYVVIDEPEARLAAQDRDGKIEDVIRKLAKRRYKKMIVTHGPHGAVGYDSERDVFCRAPAYTKRVIDTMGAGDAFFAVTAPMSKTGSIENLLKIGNAAGAMKTQIVGHRKAITKNELLHYWRQL